MQIIGKISNHRYGCRIVGPAIIRYICIPVIDNEKWMN